MRINSKSFTYSGKTQTFSSEVSELPAGLYLHANFYIVSERTGNARLFLFSEEHRDAENDVTHWTFICPGGNLSAVIFND